MEIMKNLSVLLILMGSCSQTSDKPAGFPLLTGPYLGQALPGPDPILFAPGIVSNGLSNRDITFSPDGREIIFGMHTLNFQFTAILTPKWSMVFGRNLK